MDTQKIIIEYLKGPRDYREGVALYDRFGSNLRLKQQFNLTDTETSREMLYNELRIIAGLSVSQFATLPRRAKSETPEPKRKPVEVVRHDAPTDQKEATETAKKMIRFRERFPFLNEPDCPDFLKILVADMFTCYGQFKEAHQRLREYPDEVLLEAAEDCRVVVESYLENREIWEELEHYKNTGTILGKASKIRAAQEVEDVKKLSDLDLMARYKSAQVQTSKRRAALVAADKKKDAEAIEKARVALEEWAKKKAMYQAEIDLRKKK